MARFRYVAKNMEGKVFRGLTEASAESSLQQQLSDQGLYLIKAKSAEPLRGRRSLQPKQLSEFSRELSILLSSGISIVRALEIMADEEGLSPQIRSVYADILTGIRKGGRLSEAMEEQNCFPDLMLGMIRSGEGSGTMDQVMRRLSLHYERDHRLREQVKSAMTYPFVLLVMSMAVIILIMTFILPQFEELFQEMEQLPAITEFLMAVSDFLITRWYVLLLVLCFLAAALRIIFKLGAVQRSSGYLKVHLPLIGKLNKIIYTARFSRTLSSLYSSGMPIVQALLTAGETVGNLYIEEQFEQAAALVQRGVPLSQALGEIDGFLRKLSSSIMVGEESGRLDSMLDSIAAGMEEEAEAATKRLVTLLEPVLICMMALIVGFIIIAVMLPIYESYGAIEGAA